MIELDVKRGTGLIPSATDWLLKPIEPSISNLLEKKAELGITPTATEQDKPIGFGHLNIVTSDEMPSDRILLVGGVTVVSFRQTSGNPSSVDITLRVSAVAVKSLRSA